MFFIITPSIRSVTMTPVSLKYVLDIVAPMQMRQHQILQITIIVSMPIIHATLHV